MRKYLLGLLALLIVPITANAGFLTGNEGAYVFEVGDYQTVGPLSYKFTNNGTPYTEEYKVAYKHATNYGYTYYIQFAWKEGQLYFRQYTQGDTLNGKQGFIDKRCVNSNIFTCLRENNRTNYNKRLEEFIDDIGIIKTVTYGQIGTVRNSRGNNYNGIYCLYDGSLYYCASCNGSPNTDFPCNSGLTGQNLAITPGDINTYDWDNSPIRTTKTKETCPTLKQVEDSYNLNKNVCYAGFTQNDIYGDNSTYKGGEGLTIKETRELYSGGMNLQTRYDTYRQYYKNINNDTTPFEGKSKALMGIEFARQTFGKDRTSFTILNYCNLALYTGNKNGTTCTTQQGAFSIPFEDAKPTADDIAQGIIVENGLTITPGTGTVFQQLGEYDYKEIREAFKSIFEKLTLIFQFRSGKKGIIPIYITRTLLIVVFYKIFKK